MNDLFKKNLGIFLLIAVVGMHFFCYMGSGMLNYNVFRSLHGLTTNTPENSFADNWVIITIFGRIIGAYILCKLVMRLGFFKVMRIIVIAHIILAISIVSFNINYGFTCHGLQFLFICRVTHAFFIPASFMLPSLFLLNHYSNNMLSAYTNFSVGLGVILLYQYLSITKFTEGWHHIILYVSVFSGICYFLAEKLLSKERARNIEPHVKLSRMKFLLVAAFGGTCGATFSYHFNFVNTYVKDILIAGDCQNTGFAYYYYALVASIIPASKFIYQKDFFTPIKIATIAIAFVAIILAAYQNITAGFYIAEQIIFGILAAVLIAPCHLLVYKVFKDTRNYFEGMFWFVSSFTIFAVSPHLLKVIWVDFPQWIGFLYLLPIAFLFVFALGRYEKITTTTEVISR